MAFAALATSLQRLDVLIASERRALELCEGQLFKLTDGALEDRGAVEAALCMLASGYLSPDDTLPLRIHAKQHALPMHLRQHLQWVIRALLLLREPSLLARLLHLRAVRSRDDEAWVASGVAALLDGLHPADVLRQRAVLLALCTLELRQLHARAGALVPNSFFARLVGEHLCRLPAARSFLHRALRGPLEAFLDEPRRGAARGVAAFARADDGEWRVLLADLAVELAAEAANDADCGDGTAVREDAVGGSPGYAEDQAEDDSEIEARVLWHVVDAMACQVAAFPPPLILICECSMGGRDPMAWTPSL